jgi:hypothetical protein
MFLYICFDCTNARQGYKDTKINRVSNGGQIIECPRCQRKTLKFQRPFQRLAGAIKGARTPEQESASISRAERQQKAKRRFDQVMVADDDDPPPSSKRSNTLEDDEEYVPKAIFSPSMRLTSNSLGGPTMRATNEIRSKVVASFKLMSPDTKITAAVGRSDTGTVMGKYLSPNYYRTLSAHRWANWHWLQNPPPSASMRNLNVRGAPYTTDKFRSLEWCHLVADSLGGATAGNNLVAASFGANTHMLAIESCLHARTDVTIRVTAHCSHENCAEFIVYEIINRSTKALAIGIDARNDLFPSSAYEAIRQEVNAHIGK